MARLNVAHLRDQGIDFAVFDSDAPTRLDSDRRLLLADLTDRARQAGLRIQKSALAYVQAGRLAYFGAPDLVRYLASSGIPRWTHTLDF